MNYKAYTTSLPHISFINYDKDNKLFLFLVFASTFSFIGVTTILFPLMLEVYMFFSSIMYHTSIKLS